ncbi:TonB-dependent receptor [Sphingomonas japonica]|uniref:TonB-dependent receptor n=1 Tax=Sphingomonas japonica TaxID=511662 RepID=A0ABX0TX58_9SPHN|nr:TonB-dependent receptor [Sphingomonas japonica]NIJ22883.1 TonB-dependent receptor [Sphingomonas japonica]
MATRHLRHGRQFTHLIAGVSALALIGSAQSAFAQTTQNDPVQETDQAPPPLEQTDLADEDAAVGDIVVTGIRASLANAQEIKRRADTVVDAITAEDIGALPDRSINEALQRIPGVSIDRFAAPNDSQHFSVEGSGVQIRGLTYTRGEFNGRDTFSVSAGRDIGYNDIPAELAGSVEVFKNLTADLIEGGIAGTVSINTRKPFDSNDRILYLSGGVSYGDLAQQAEGSFAGLYSNQWEVGDGHRVGLLVGGSYFQQRSRADSIFLSSFLPRFNAPDDGVDGYAPDGVDYQGSQFDGVTCDGNNPNEGRLINEGTPYQLRVCDNFPTPEGFDTVYTPSGAGFRQQSFNTKRNSIAAAGQFETADESLLITAQYLRAESIESWVDRTVEPNIYYNDIGNTYPAGYIQQDGFPYDPNANYTFNDDGVFTGGTIVRRGNLQARNLPGGANCGFYDPPANTAPITYCPYDQFVNPGGINTASTNRYFSSKSVNQDASLNIKWQASDRLRFNFDAQYAKSEAEGTDDIVDIYTFSNVTIDLQNDIPNVSFVTPGFDTTSYFANQGSWFYNNAFNNRSINDGDEYAFRADGEFDVSEDGFLRKLRFGGRYSKRQQTVRTNDYNNWGSLSATWVDQGPRFVSVTPDAINQYNYENFFRGEANVPSVPSIRADILSDHDALTELLRRAKDPSGQFSYTPLEDRTPNGVDELIEGYFQPNEVYDNSEETKAAYARLDFGTDFDSGMRLSGNIGVRWVQTTNEAAGAINFPQRNQVLPDGFADFAAYCAEQTEVDPITGESPSQSQLPALCRTGVTAEQQAAALAFANGASLPQVAEQTFDNWLPSLNVRFDASDKLTFRFAASKAINRPNFGDLRNFVSLGFNGNTGVFEARSSNPFLKPIKADQFDLSAEWYFARVGSLTATGFYKKLTDVIVQNSGFNRTFENGGSSYDLQLTGPANALGSSDIKGVELAYQQTYDFLPGPLSGLGLQAAYTYIDAGRIIVSPPDFRPSTDPTPNEGDGNQPPQDIQGLYDNIPLPQLSKHNVNTSVFFDKYGIYARLAYNWRSKFLLSNRDCCFPFLPVYSLATDSADASLFYTVNEQFKIGVQVNNLFDYKIRTTFQLNGDGLEAPRSFFKSDRQVQLSVRLTL